MNDPFIYIPEDARINIAPDQEEVPKTRYDQNQAVFDQEEVKKVVKGNYGKKSDRTTGL